MVLWIGIVLVKIYHNNIYGGILSMGNRSIHVSPFSPSLYLLSHYYITVKPVCVCVCLSVCLCHFLSRPAVTLCLPFFEQTSRDSVSAIFLSRPAVTLFLPFFEQTSRDSVSAFFEQTSCDSVFAIFWVKPNQLLGTHPQTISKLLTLSTLIM